MTREQTLSDMKDNLLRLQALESHVNMFCNKKSQSLIWICRRNMEQAIKAEESNG